MAATAALEPHIDGVIKHFCDHLGRRFVDVSEEKREFDLGKWILLCKSLNRNLAQRLPLTTITLKSDTWDVTGAVTFSKRFGYLDEGHDFNGTLHAADKAQDYFVVVGVIPFLDKIFDKNPVHHIGPPGFNASTGISIQHLGARYAGEDKSYHDPEVPDFLDKFIEAKKANPEEVDDGQIISWLMVNMIAGSDVSELFQFLVVLKTKLQLRQLQSPSEVPSSTLSAIPQSGENSPRKSSPPILVVAVLFQFPIKMLELSTTSTP